MVSFAARFLAIIALVCALHEATAENVNNVKTWGVLSAQVVLGSTKSKFGVPFVQRSLELSYPEDFNIEGPEANLNIVKGIKHTDNINDPKCPPTSEIIKGGIEQKFATVKITAPRGCALDSLVEFYIERQIPMKKEIIN